jgi:putative peptide zinc metalloprotease protein
MLASEDIALPVLRDDLQLTTGPTAADGSPSWTIYDPLRNRYFRIGWAAFQMLSFWAAGSIRSLQNQLKINTTCELKESDIREFIRFLFSNNLTLQPIEAGYQAYLQQYRASRPIWYKQLLHSYLFFRIPLIRPDRFLRATLPYLQWCFDVRLLYVLLSVGLLALYLISRQWDSFSATFLHFFDWQGAIFYGLALTLTKLLHELGHAYTAVRYGCRVPVIGVAFMMLLPMPYTDVTDAWRLPLRRQRLAIGVAGIVVELALAVMATLAWSFLPDGGLRSAAFILATTTWIMTLSINISPFMRFDGYYLLSDAWGIDNLQARAFALARWQFRQKLLGLHTPKPEQLPLSTERKMQIYAYATWLYRLVVFTGLALMVYQLFFKLLGLILFAIEIGWFIVKPILTEIKQWQDLGIQHMSRFRKNLIFTILFGLSLLVFLPWSDSVYLPAIMEAEQHTVLFAPEAAQIDSILVKTGQPVAAGQILIKLQSPKLDEAISLSEKRLTYLQLHLQRASSSSQSSADIRVARQQWSAEASRLNGLKHQQEQLQVRASFAGVIAEMATNLHPQRWIEPTLPLITLTAPDKASIEAIADKDALMAIAVGQTGEFVPEDILHQKVAVQVEAIGSINLTELGRPYLASIYGGAIAVRKTAAAKLTPSHSAFTVKLTTDTPAPVQLQRGTAIIKAKPRSFAERIFENTAVLLIRESGF